MRRSATLLVTAVSVPTLVAVLSTMPAGEAAEECAAKPTSTAPRGSHWYYRLDRSTNRRCWFLAPEGERVMARHTAPSARRPAAPGSVGIEARPSEPAPIVPETKSPALAQRLLWPAPMQWAGIGTPDLQPLQPSVAEPAAETAAETDLEHEAPPPLEAEAPPLVATASVRSVPFEYVLACLSGALALAAFITSKIARSGRASRGTRGSKVVAVPATVPAGSTTNRAAARRASAPAGVQDDPIPAFLLRPAPWLPQQPPADAETRSPPRPAKASRSATAQRQDDDIERRLERLLREWQRAAA
ncbi:MAG: hypothetical protein IT537_14755 [Hyphomicrobiales bacterium]|nr:hypothetical protein [Hyphomicrobiales bacterium]